MLTIAQPTLNAVRPNRFTTSRAVREAGGVSSSKIVLHDGYDFRRTRPASVPVCAPFSTAIRPFSTTRSQYVVAVDQDAVVGMMLVHRREVLRAGQPVVLGGIGSV